MTRSQLYNLIEETLTERAPSILDSVVKITKEIQNNSEPNEAKMAEMISRLFASSIAESVTATCDVLSKANVFGALDE